MAAFQQMKRVFNSSRPTIGRIKRRPFSELQVLEQVGEFLRQPSEQLLAFNLLVRSIANIAFQLEIMA